MVARREKQEIFPREERRETRKCAETQIERLRKSQEMLQRQQEEFIAGHHWAWGRQSWQAGEPGEMPKWVWWEQEQWEQWLECDSTKSYD